MDRFEVLAWLIGREGEGAGPPDGAELLGALPVGGEQWGGVARAVGELMRLGWIRGDWMRWPGRDREPNPAAMTVNDLQRYKSFQVTEKGYAMERNRSRETPGPIFNISDSTIGQLAGGDINNLTIEKMLVAIGQAIDRTPGSDEEKREAHAMLGRAREAVLGIGSGAAGGVLAAAIKSVLGIP
ncbi:MAG TPA: hypothetical protein VNM38_04780 [Solirubrobacterales bacterium]|nr:hypothetical protein [Solirubrobacterales bacterium]